MIFHLFFLFVFVFFLQANAQENLPGNERQGLTIKIIAWNNGVGLSQDVDIIQTELRKLGHHVSFIDETEFAPYPKVDINLFIESSFKCFASFLPFAEKNYFIPNPEWCSLSPQEISHFDMILCKTKEAERIFKPINDNVVFIGFTSKDCYQENISKNYKLPFHLMGSSIQKGTDRLVKMWLHHPQFPSLTIIKNKNGRNKEWNYSAASNIHLIFDYLPTDKLRFYQNNCGLHLCPSETEGFGHYIMEGLSSGAVVVTTDAPPMNELITDQRCLVGYHETSSFNYATSYYVDPIKLETVIAHLLSLPEEELKEIGKKNRDFYLENDRLFKVRLADVFKADLKLTPKQDNIEQAFTRVYETKEWGANPSGEGSTPENTLLYRFFLQNFLKEHHIQHVVDLGCGDWGFSCLIDWTGIKYNGYDVYGALIERNQRLFGSPTIQFIHANGLKEDLPKADLLICKDILQHLPEQEIKALFPQLSKFKYILLINDVDPLTLTSDNRNIRAGEYRLLDLTKPPFHLSGQKVLTFICGGVTKQVLLIKN